jgi:hypothetical protein
MRYTKCFECGEMLSEDGEYSTVSLKSYDEGDLVADGFAVFCKDCIPTEMEDLLDAAFSCYPTQEDAALMQKVAEMNRKTNK